MEYTHIIHPFGPVFDENSRVLILGSLPSVKSREDGFFYGHPQNRFWKVLAAITGEALPLTKEEKAALLLRNGIALWDVIASCDIKGSGDGSIKNAVPTDLAPILKGSRVERVFANGQKAAALYKRFQRKQTDIEAIPLPSTSPANAAWSLERLVEAWGVLVM